ncbi:MAG: hypothetical protein HXP14_02540 [Veillonella sp.]|nr:hypothetical protein [Veillonella sp.]
MNRVIFYNELIGTKECIGHQSIDKNSFYIKGINYNTRDIVVALYNDGKYVCNSYFESSGKATELIKGIPSTTKLEPIGALIFELVVKTDKKLIIEVSEWYKSEDYKVSIALIAVSIQVSTNRQSVEALIDIYDVDEGCLSISTEKALVEFAQHIGMYAVDNFDGDRGGFNNKENIIGINNDTKRILSEIESMKNTQNERFDRVDKSLVSIESRVQALQDDLKASRMELSERLKPNLDEVISESYIKEFIDTVSNHIVSRINDRTDSDYSDEGRTLELTFKSSWNKLSDKSKSFLTTARVMFKNLDKSNGEVDYSGVCILLSKAVEVELNRRLYHDFKDYLQEICGDNFDQWHTYMVEDGRDGTKPLRESRFTLGTIPHLLGLIKNKNLDEYQLNHNKELLRNFGKRKLTVSDDEIESSFKNIAKRIQRITENYRNPAAHTNILSKYTAQECFDEIVDVQKVLIEILEYFRN